MRQPPRLASALLTRLGHNNPALVGDLHEAYRAGRSALWYWRQVLASVVGSAARELWTDKWLGVQAVSTMLGLEVVLRAIWTRLWFQTALSARVQDFTVAVWGPQDPLVNAPYRWIFTLALVPLPILIGWIVAKFHPRQRGATVMICCIVVIALGIPRLVALMDDRIAMNMYLQISAMAITLTGLVCGAFIAGSTEPSTEQIRSK
jgi:hypothetical protein